MPNNTPSSLESSSVYQTEIIDLIGIPPGWLLRSGTMMVALVTGVILLGSYLFKYPEKLSGSGALTSNSPPIEIVSRGTGYIEKLLISESEFVDKGSPILYLSNTTNIDQLGHLQNWIIDYELILEPDQYLKLEFVKNLQLGELQSEYANLQLKYNEFQQTLNNGVVFQQLRNLSREVGKIKILNQSKQREKEIYNNEVVLTKRDYDRNESLFAEGAISTLKLEKAKTILLQKERQYEGMNNIIIQNNIRIEQLELEKLNLQQKRAETLMDYQFSIAEIITKIKASIQDWKHKYTIAAPISGKITFAIGINENKNLVQGETIGYIMPGDSHDKYISAIYSSERVGNINMGQKAIVKFDAYPYKEFGSVISEVKSIGQIPMIDKNGKSTYEIKIPIDDIIITDYQDTLKFNPNMTVITEIITENKTVFQRIFDQFMSLLKTH